ncbi:L-seryl-tRNA(SeC) selenium transferase [Helicobacter mustelae]|uniref:L-seryl-tRNA(Sec) selenium transferase n=1 Tax=Helicobacter mustelae TaxID=217 RepID=UPI000DFAAF6D|nr:L-seryl-tRNA(Sec) selenium transferase [Helicobacter mustelae]STP12730.1 L-seryl-tRNA(SeC) selenium transferase [Helicobacter mustelae]
MQKLLSQLPKMDKILHHKDFASYNKILLKKIARKTLSSYQTQIQNKTLTKPPILQDLLKTIKQEYQKITSPTLRPLINATGVVLQTNLGRSILSKKLLSKVFGLFNEYCNLEYDLQSGQRGSRDEHVREILCALLDCEDALVVNNNAAALLLIISTFAKQKEVILSRGELIEIGGSFRIPEIIKDAGARLMEVGTTNKTHLQDYERAIGEHTAMLLKVHKSNFTQSGFVSSIELSRLIALAKAHGVLDYYDAGSGYICGLDCDEPSLLDIAELRPSLVSFSGDKLLGGVQAGIIFGKKELITKLRQNHLLRALRMDKLNLALLQQTLLCYLQNRLDEIPTIAMLKTPLHVLEQRAKMLLSLITPLPSLESSLVFLESCAGGGSLPDMRFPSYGVALECESLATKELARLLRQEGVITRSKNEKILLDVRCLQERHCKKIAKILQKITGGD